MPSLENIAGAVAGTGSRHIRVEAGRCVEVRHRMARCHACVDACPEGAIEVANNRVRIRSELCVGCGTCASECPTQALQTVHPSLSELTALVEEIAPEALSRENPATLEFACEHAPASNATARIIVPALPYVDESVIVRAAALGFDTVALTSCNHASCMKPTLAAMPDVLQTARNLLFATESSCKVSLRRQKPRSEGDGADRKAHRNSPHIASDTTHDAVHGSHDFSRRGALSDMATQMKTIVAETAAAEMREHLGTPERESSLRETLVDSQGNFLKFDMPRSESLLNDLYTLNPEPSGMLQARGFARVEVNATACTRCGMCVKFCPSGALEGEAVPIGRTDFGAWRPPGLVRAEEPKTKGSLTFRTSDCVGCHLCEFSCPLHCLKVHDEVDAASIFELEPVDLLTNAPSV